MHVFGVKSLYQSDEIWDRVLKAREGVLLVLNANQIGLLYMNDKELKAGFEARRVDSYHE